jgi:hypothetical protein
MREKILPKTLDGTQTGFYNESNSFNAMKGKSNGYSEGFRERGLGCELRPNQFVNGSPSSQPKAMRVGEDGMATVINAN